MYIYTFCPIFFQKKHLHISIFCCTFAADLGKSISFGLSALSLPLPRRSGLPPLCAPPAPTL